MGMRRIINLCRFGWHLLAPLPHDSAAYHDELEKVMKGGKPRDPHSCQWAVTGCPGPCSGPPFTAACQVVILGGLGTPSPKAWAGHIAPLGIVLLALVLASFLLLASLLLAAPLLRRRTGSLTVLTALCPSTTGGTRKVIISCRF